MNLRRRKISIISVSLLLHILVLILLLIFYKSPEHEWVYFDNTKTAINTPETVFAEQPQTYPEQQQPIPQITQEDNSWAELKPRASSLGSSMEMPDDAPPSLRQEASADRQDENAEEEEMEAGADEQSNTTENQNDTTLRQAQDELKENIINYIHAEPVKAPSDISNLKNELKTAKSSLAQKVSIKKRQAQKALATMTRGYLEQLKQEGENLIKTIGGDPNKMPSAEQLKYERYLAKIQWCLQNAHAINRDKCQTHEPIEATMRVYFTLNRAGKMADLKIIQSSGNAFVDRYIRELFEQASSSFPPLPTYIKEDPYQLLYSVLVCWNVANPLYMGLMRE